MIKAPEGLELMTYRFVANALTLLGNSVGKEKKILRIIFDFLFQSIRSRSQYGGVTYHLKQIQTNKYMY